MRHLFPTGSVFGERKGGLLGTVGDVQPIVRFLDTQLKDSLLKVG